MKMVLVLSVMLSSVNALAKSSYFCSNSNNGGHFGMTVRAGNEIAYEQSVTSMGKVLYKWMGTLRPAETCAKNASCYTGDVSAKAARPSFPIPKTLIRMKLEVPTAILNGASKGKVKRTNNDGTKTYDCELITW